LRRGEVEEMGSCSCLSRGEHLTFAIDPIPMPSSPNPFSQDWEKGRSIKVPLPRLGEGFRERAASQ